MKTVRHYEKHFLPFADAFELNISGPGYYTNRKGTDSIVYSHENAHSSEPQELFEQIKEWMNKF